MDIAHIVTNPAEYGFKWDFGAVSSGGRGDKGTILANDAPCIVVTDIATFASRFEAAALNGMNGQSIRVQCQAIARRMLLKDRKSSKAVMQATMVSSVLLNVRTRTAIGTREVRYLAMPDGSKVDVTAGITDDIRRTYAVQLVDMGIVSETALQIANNLK